ncbi:MAG: hypothetical protein HOK61_04925 [Alphaproteobacteria bacterium]|nr:hypothetical protein [Alphaproteobacteria bacterium]
MPGMISCEELETFILDYLDDDLPAPKKRVFERHLKMCQECRDYLAAYCTSLALAKQAVAIDDGIDNTDIPEDLVTAIIEARNTK